jgi:hypothetical protein
MKFGRAAASRHHHPGVQRRHQHPADAAIDHAAVNTPLRVLICYDREDDDTLPAIRNHRAVLGALTIAFVRTSGRGAHGAVLSGFAASCCRRTTIITSAFSTAGADDVPAGFGARHQQQLADAARIGVATVRLFESEATETRQATLAVLRQAFEFAGVEFTNGDQPGVRLTKAAAAHSGRRKQSGRPARPPRSNDR